MRAWGYAATAILFAVGALFWLAIGGLGSEGPIIARLLLTCVCFSPAIIMLHITIQWVGDMSIGTFIQGESEFDLPPGPEERNQP